jgi:hypothetical protein
MWDAIQKCMETKLGISLYSYLYLKLVKILCLSYYLLYFLFNKIRDQEGRTGSDRKGGSRRCWEEGELNEKMYTHVSKCKTDKIKERKKPNCGESHSR